MAGRHQVRRAADVVARLLVGDRGWCGCSRIAGSLAESGEYGCARVHLHVCVLLPSLTVAEQRSSGIHVAQFSLRDGSWAMVTGLHEVE